MISVCRVKSDVSKTYSFFHKVFLINRVTGGRRDCRNFVFARIFQLYNTTTVSARCSSNDGKQKVPALRAEAAFLQKNLSRQTGTRHLRPRGGTQERNLGEMLQHRATVLCWSVF